MVDSVRFTATACTTGGAPSVPSEFGELAKDGPVAVRNGPVAATVSKAGAAIGSGTPMTTSPLEEGSVGEIGRATALAGARPFEPEWTYAGRASSLMSMPVTSKSDGMRSIPARWSVRKSASASDAAQAVMLTAVTTCRHAATWDRGVSVLNTWTGARGRLGLGEWPWAHAAGLLREHRSLGARAQGARAHVRAHARMCVRSACVEAAHPCAE